MALKTNVVAQIVNLLTIWGMRELSDDEMLQLLNKIDNANVNTKLQPSPKASVAEVDELLSQLNNKDGLMSAIRAYRVLTNAGLKESKEAIERYRKI